MNWQDAFNKWKDKTYPDLHAGFPYYGAICEAFEAAWNAGHEPMPCGHPRACVVEGKDGTNYCKWCAESAGSEARIEFWRNIAKSCCPEDIKAVLGL